jgi:arsenate reductase (glutaredoxin)
MLSEAGVVPEVIPVRAQPPTQAELKAMLDRYGGETRRLFNTSGLEYRRLGLKDRLGGLSEAEAIALLAGNGNLVKRPFVVVGNDGWVGFDPAEWRARLQAACPGR